jgi:hypothetical protein
VTALVVSVISTCIAGVSLSWNVLNVLRDRGRVHFTVRANYALDPTTQVPSKTPVLSFTVTNTGRRAVYFWSPPFGGDFANGEKFMDAGSGLPPSLAPGESRSFQYPVSLLTDELVTFHILGAGAWKNTPVWRVSRQDMKALRKSLASN